MNDALSPLMRMVRRTEERIVELEDENELLRRNFAAAADEMSQRIEAQDESIEHLRAAIDWIAEQAIATLDEDSPIRQRALAALAVSPHTPIEELDFGSRAYNCLAGADIRSVEQLSNRTEAELEAISGLGPTTIDEIKRVIAANGFELRQELNQEAVLDALRELSSE